MIMRLKIVLSYLLFFLCGCFASVSAQDEYDVFLLIGQSNMAGRGYMVEGDEDVFDENVFILDNQGDIVPATNPLNQYSSIRKGMNIQRICPGYGFARKISTETGRKILLVVNARGGTTISQWAKGEGGEGYYEEAVRRAGQAMKYGELKAILWHQGCGDARNVDTYMANLTALVSNLRADLNAQDLPFIAGELGQWRPHVTAFNEMIHTIADHIPYSDWVSSDGCLPIVTERSNGQPDLKDPHFDRESQILIGERYADKVLDYCYAQEGIYVFNDGLLDDVTPKGWLKDFLENQRSGMTGKPESMSYPYDSNLWDGEIVRNTDTYGSDWWRYEQTAYYTDGLLRLAYLLDDEGLAKKAEAGIIYTLTHADSTGRLPHATFKKASMWPMAVFWRAMKAYYDKTHDENIPKILEKHYLTYTLEDIQNWRNILCIEGMLWTYGKTGNQVLLDRCVEAWKSGKFGDLTPDACFADMTPFMHGVTFSEELKLPLLLYAYTGEQYYLDAAMNAYEVMERNHMLPSGVHSSAEAMLGNGNIINSHETCNVSDLTWTQGYFLQVTGDAEWADRIEKAVFNAGMGSVTNDFKALQYFSSVNQFRVTGDSNHNGFFHGSTWMAYRPTHQTECCAGNVHRFMPNYLSRMWLKSDNGGIVAAMYGPSEVRFETEEGISVTISEETDYPYDGNVTFQIVADKPVTFDFTYRIPEWADNAVVTLAGEKMGESYAERGMFHTVKVNAGKDQVKMVLELPMVPELKRLGEGCHAYDEAGAKYFKGRGKIEPTSVVNTAVENNAAGTDDTQAVYVQRGPLLYSFAIPQTQTEDLVNYENMHGKVPGDASFKCWSFEPAGDWNYAVDLTTEVKLEYVDGVVRMPVRKIEWNLEDNRYTPRVPSPEDVKTISDEIEYIELVPYGGTQLRLTVFPVIKSVQLTGNPLWNGEWYADPEVAVFDGKYWIFPTCSKPFKEQLFMDCFSSDDLVTWTKYEKIITKDNIPELNEALWAPSVIEKDGKYYLYFSINNVPYGGEPGGICVAVADSPEGPYGKAEIIVPDIVNGAQPIDQFVFRDDDGYCYMYYGGWDHCNMMKMGEDMKSFVPFDVGQMVKEVTPQGYVEGPFMLKRNGKYYFMWSEGRWKQDNYRVAYAISDSPFGPFDRVGVILESDPLVGTGAGHHSVFQGPGDDEWYIVYHRHPLDATDGNNRVTCIDRMYFDSEGKIKPVKMTFEGVEAINK